MTLCRTCDDTGWYDHPGDPAGVQRSCSDCPGWQHGQPPMTAFTVSREAPPMIELRIIHRPDVDVPRAHVGPRVLAWSDLVRGQHCAACAEEIGGEGCPSERVQLLMLGADLIGQQVREAAGFVHLARCLPIHRRCAEAMDGQEISDLATRVRDVLTGV